MLRLTPHVGVVAALALAVLFITISGDVSVKRDAVPSAPIASSTLSVVSTITLPPLVIPDLGPRTSQASTPEQTVAPSPVPVAPPKVISPVQKTAPTSTPVTASSPATTPAPPPTAPSGNIALDASASTLRAALVNIICYAPPGTKVHSISGSGVIVDSRGIILTNSHIAQYFLLADRDVSCTIRSGSPAADSYRASLIYIPSAWISANATVLTQANAIGTGEYDFALLAVTKSISRNALPTTFPFIPLATLPPNTGTPVVIASYGAQFLESSQIQSSLFPTVVFGSVKDVFTFANNTIDVLALGGSAAAQEGSSGGGVADGNGELVGTITTSTTEGTTDTRKLDAITVSYIRAEYASETGQALDLLLAQSPATSVANFAPQISTLESVLTAQLN